MDQHLELVADGAVHLNDLPASTTLVVWTRNSVYRMTIIEGTQVVLQGGLHFPQPCVARIDGARLGGTSVKTGSIHVGLTMEICANGLRIVTSPVGAIAAETRRLAPGSADCARPGA